MGLTWSIVILILLFLYEVILSPMICKRKIYKHITNIGGTVTHIERLTPKEYLYSVNYTISDRAEKSIAQFNIFFKCIWK